MPYLVGPGACEGTHYWAREPSKSHLSKKRKKAKEKNQQRHIKKSQDQQKIKFLEGFSAVNLTDLVDWGRIYGVGPAKFT